MPSDVTQTTVIRNAAVFTADASRSWATAVAFSGGRLVAVGGDAEVADHVRSADEVIDAGGALVTPGFIDAHMHPVQGGIERTRCDLVGATTIEEYVGLLRAYVATPAGAEGPWVLGAGWSMEAFPNGLPTKEILDAVVPDRPAYLPNRDHHSGWANSRALELAGITRETPDPAGGVITRDADGHPTGALHEAAMTLVERILPPTTEAELAAGLREAQEHVHGLGVTGWQDAMVTSGPAGLHEAYLAAQAEGRLTARVAGALWFERDQPDIAAEVARHVVSREQARTASTDQDRTAPRYTAPTIKMMLDGVAETFTAAMIDPYCVHDGHGGGTGLTFFEPAYVLEAVTALDAAGFGIHFHALGDRAVRLALDAVAAARQANGTADRRHQLAHLQVVHPDDRARFRQLGAAANLQPLWGCHEPQMDELTLPFMGPDRAEEQYPFGGLFRDGATLVAGSDWPVSSPDPWAGIHVAVNRTGPGAPADEEPLGAHHALPLGVALTAYTAGSAWSTRLDEVAGSLVVGKAADVVLHDRNPFDRPTDEICQTRVQRTYVGGRPVFQR
jgi:predicted amidohydrolase YtcJ